MSGLKKRADGLMSIGKSQCCSSGIYTCRSPTPKGCTVVAVAENRLARLRTGIQRGQIPSSQATG